MWATLLAWAALAGDNVGDAIRAQKKCYQGDGAACEDAGNRYLRGIGVVADSGLAVHLFEDGCEAGRASACTLAGNALLTNGEESDLPKVVAAFRKGCDAGDGDGCALLAEATWDAEGVPFDPVAAVALAERACAEGSALGCAIAGEISASDDTALARFRTACAAGSGRGCVDLAVRGHGDPIGVAWGESACAAGDADGCLLVAAAHRNGWGRPADPAAAADAAARACGSYDDCEMLGWRVLNGLAGHAREQQLAREAWGAACRNNGWYGCLSAAWIARRTDPPASRALYARACAADHPAACHAEGFKVKVGSGLPGQGRDTWRWRGQDCASYHASACETLGWMETVGFGGPADADAAAGHTQQACRAGDTSACGDVALDAWERSPAADAGGLWSAARSDADTQHVLARLLVSGEVEAAPGRPTALDLASQACLAGIGDACVDLATLGGCGGGGRGRAPVRRQGGHRAVPRRRPVRARCGRERRALPPGLRPGRRTRVRGRRRPARDCRPGGSMQGGRGRVCGSRVGARRGPRARRCAPPRQRGVRCGQPPRVLAGGGRGSGPPARPGVARVFARPGGLRGVGRGPARRDRGAPAGVSGRPGACLRGARRAAPRDLAGAGARAPARRVFRRRSDGRGASRRRRVCGSPAGRPQRSIRRSRTGRSASRAVWGSASCARRRRSETALRSRAEVVVERLKVALLAVIAGGLWIDTWRAWMPEAVANESSPVTCETWEVVWSGQSLRSAPTARDRIEPIRQWLEARPEQAPVFRTQLMQLNPATRDVYSYVEVVCVR